MAINVGNKLIDNDLDKSELLKRVEIRKTCEDDLEAICRTRCKAFDLESPHDAFAQMMNSNALLDESVKLVDRKTGDIYGLLMFCEYPISIGSPIHQVDDDIDRFLNQFKQINGHSFIIDSRLRGTGLDRKMLFYNIDFLRKNYDMIWIGVESSLRSHNYWKRHGFVDIFSIPEATFYMIPLNKNVLK